MTRIRVLRSFFRGPQKQWTPQGLQAPVPAARPFKKRRSATTGKTPPQNGGTSSLVQVASTPNDQEDGGQAELNYLLLSLVDGSRDARGHRFATTRDTSNNLQIKCEDCGLWIQQTDSKSVFNREVANSCKNPPLSTPSADWGWHASHNMCNEGFRWKCTRCQGVQAVGGLTPATLERVCAHGMSCTSRKRAALDSQAAAGTRSVASAQGQSGSSGAGLAPGD